MSAPGRLFLAAVFLVGCSGSARGPAAGATTPLPQGANGASGALPLPRAPGPELEAALTRLHAASGDDVPAAMFAVALSEDPVTGDHLLLELAGEHAPEAASALPLLGGEAAAQGLLVALDHASPSVRLRAASGLRALRADSTLAPLLAHLSSRRSLSRETCRMLVVAAARVSGAPRAAEVREALAHLPASCDVGAAERAAVDWHLGAPGALAAALRAPNDALDDDELHEAVRQAADAASLATAREILRESHRPDSIQQAAQICARSNDAQARDIVHARLAGPDPAACAIVTAGMFGGPEVADRGACDELRALVVAAGLLSDPRDLPLLQRLSAPARPRGAARGAPADGAGRSPLVDDALYARAVHAGSAGDPEIARILDEGGAGARALMRAWPRVATPVALALLARAPGAAPTDSDVCTVLLEWEDPRRLEPARAFLRRDDVPADCRPWAGVILARHGTDEDRRLVAGVVATRIAERDASAGSGPAAAALMGPSGRMAVVWARVAAELPAALRPEWSIVRAAIDRSAAFLVPKDEPDAFFPSGAVELGALDAIVALRAGRAPAPAPALLQLVRARTAGTRVAGPALGRILAGTSDRDAEALLGALLPDLAAAPERGRRARAEELGRLLAAALASRDARARAFAQRRLPSSPVEARAELARRILTDEAVPAAEALALLDDPSPLTVAALALRCGSSCVSGIASRLSAPRSETRAAAAVVASAMREPALAEPLLALAHGEGNAATEAAVALTLLHRADDEARRRLEEGESRLGMEEGLPGRISLARTIEGIAPPWGSFRGAGLWSCRWTRGELPASREGREDARETLVNAAIVLRTHPDRLEALSPERQSVAAEDLQQALACLGGAVDLSEALEPLVGSSSVGLRRVVTPVVLEHAQTDPGTPLLERLATDTDPAVRERVVASFRSTMPGAVRPFGGLVGRLARDAAPAVRQAAVRVLPAADFDATPLVVAALEDPEAEVRRAVLENPDLPSSHATHRVAPLADDPDVSVRMAVAAALGDAAFAGALPALRRLVANEATRAPAMRSLCRRGSREDLPRVVDAFRRLPATERQTARFGFATARRLLGADPAPAVRGVLGDRDPEIARLGVVMLSMSPLDETIEVLEAAQRHRFPAVRRELAGTISRLQMPDARDTPAAARLRALAQRLLQDPDPTVKCRALSSLAPAELPQDELDRLTGEAGASVESLRDRWGCANMPFFD